MSFHGEWNEPLGNRVEKTYMAVFRFLALLVLAASLGVCGGSFALADPPASHGHGHGHGPGGQPQEQSDQSDQSPGAPRFHAVVAGTVVGVDYGSANILVGTPHGLVPVAVTPTTSIIHGSHAASLSDLGKGARVSIDVTDVGGRLIAQIIRIR